MVIDYDYTNMYWCYYTYNVTNNYYTNINVTILMTITILLMFCSIITLFYALFMNGRHLSNKKKVRKHTSNWIVYFACSESRKTICSRLTFSRESVYTSNLHISSIYWKLSVDTYPTPFVSDLNEIEADWYWISDYRLLFQPAIVIQ